MNPPTASQPFVPLFETSRQPSAPGLSASIWAPQPQPSDNTWSKAIQSISRVNEELPRDLRPEYRRANSHPIRRNSEDVFGPVIAGAQDKRAVGAIGDGRKQPTPDYDAMVRGFFAYDFHKLYSTSMIQHVHQLLRTLNLNSPGPFSSEPFVGDFHQSSISPDVSPISTNSALLTPPDQSPAKGFGEWKFNPAYDFPSAYQPQAPGSLLFETDPHLLHDYSILQHPLYQAPLPTEASHHSSRPFPTFEPFQERLNPVPTSNALRVREPLLSMHGRPESSFLTSTWARPRHETSSVDWTQPEELRSTNSSGGQGEPNLSPSRSHAGGSVHEVSCAVQCRTIMNNN
jgi:pumilio RNA-binding family